MRGVPSDAHAGRPQHQQTRSTTMQVHEDSIPAAPKPWNKGKLIGAKPPLWPKHVWSIRTKLHIEGRILELALFNLAIDSKLRGCDVVAVKVEDVALARIRTGGRVCRVHPRPGSLSGQGEPSSEIRGTRAAHRCRYDTLPWHEKLRDAGALGPGRVIGVLGIGGLGGYAVQYAQLLGGGAKVVAFARNPNKLAIAKNYG